MTRNYSTSPVLCFYTWLEFLRHPVHPINLHSAPLAQCPHFQKSSPLFRPLVMTLTPFGKVSLCVMHRDSSKNNSYRSNRSVLEEINSDCSLEGQILKMKLKCFGHLMRRKDSLEKSLLLGTSYGKRRGRQRMRWLDGVTRVVGVGLGGLRGMWRTGGPGGVLSVGSRRVGHDFATSKYRLGFIG
ncbi:Nuclear receptor-binding protein [Varanus komodoensis]|nr:Nuclear receptor-binding protein [Varanus komodoensis]